jgi:TonB family protein
MLPDSATRLSPVLTIKQDEVQQHEYWLEVSRQRVYLEFEVERPARELQGERGPRYPNSMRSANIEGEVLAQFVVDSLGLAEPATFKVLRSPRVEFTTAVRDALPFLRFEPAEIGGRKVRQLVQVPFLFCLTRDRRTTATADSVDPSWWVRRPTGCTGGAL